MNKRAISALIAVSLVVGTGYQAFATPTQSQQQAVDQNKKELNEVNAKISKLNEEIDKLSEKIQPLVYEIEVNKEEIDKTTKEIDETAKEVEQKKKEIKELEAKLGSRIRASYKSGGQTSYIESILSSEGIADMISRIQAITKIMSIDKEMIDEVNKTKKELDEKISSLQSKNAELDKLNKENQAKLDEFNKMKAEQEKIADELKAEQAKVEGNLADSEREIVKDHISTVTNANNSVETINNGITTLRAIRNQITTQEVDDEIVAAIEKGKEIIASKNAAQAPGNSNGGSTNSGNAPNRGGGSQVAPPASSTGVSVANYALQFIGRPYVWGATGPDSFDCSGFTQYVYRQFGRDITRTTYSQVNQGKAVSRDQLAPGDLVFTSGTVSAPTHVGIYIGNGQMVHAPRTGENVKVSSVYNFVTARRIL